MNDIETWVNGADKTQVSHVLIVNDDFDNETYPVEVLIAEDVEERISDYNGRNMQRVMEVYNLGMDIEEQVASLLKVWNDQPYEKQVECCSDECHERSSWALTWMSIALQYANHRSVDPATRHGCIFVSKNNKLLAMGYNSFPADCQDDKLPLTRPEKYEIIVHSETNAIINSERSLEGATAYITGFPCPRCFGNMINAKIKKIVYGPVGSHQLRDSDMKLIEQLNISAKSPVLKIKIVKFEDIEDLDKLCGSFEQTKQYVESKIQQTGLING
jgi:dCMP deaminase